MRRWKPLEQTRVFFRCRSLLLFRARLVNNQLIFTVSWDTEKLSVYFCSKHTNEGAVCSPFTPYVSAFTVDWCQLQSAVVINSPRKTFISWLYAYRGVHECDLYRRLSGSRILIPLNLQCRYFIRKLIVKRGSCKCWKSDRLHMISSIFMQTISVKTWQMLNLLDSKLIDVVVFYTQTQSRLTATCNTLGNSCKTSAYL